MMPGEQLKEFLARALPWPDETQNFYNNAHWFVQGQNGRFMAGRAAKSPGELAGNIKWAMSLGDTRDIFINMSAQAQAETKTSKNGRTYLVPVRKQENVVGLKSLFIDIDVGKEGGYADLKEAFTAVGNFTKASGIPRPTMCVGSGGGCHLHWLFDRALPRQEWQPLANALVEATRRHGLKCDTGVTVDSARLLRPPETFNWKLADKRPTRFIGRPLDFDYSVEAIEKALAPYKGAHSSSPALPALGPLPARLAGAVVENELGANVQTKAADVDLDQVATECEFIRTAINDGGAAFSNHLWNLTTLIATFGEGKRGDAHRMADQHSGYDADKTDILYSRKETERASKNLGWPKCSAILNAGFAKCKDCKHLLAGKSPLNLGIKSPAQVTPAAPVSDLPNKYVRDSKGIILAMKTDNEGNTGPVPVLDYPMTDAWLQKNPWVLNFTTTTHLGVQAQIAVPFEKVTKDSIQKCLQSQGMIVKVYQQKNTLEFFMSWMAHLQQQKNSVINTVPYGWNISPSNGKIDGFVYAGKIWKKNGQVAPAANADPELTRQYSPHGDRKPWDKAAQLVLANKRPELNALMASSFGAPLMIFTGHSGSLLSAFSNESGVGKSSAIQVAQSVWGDPIRKQQLDDTLAQSAKKMGLLYSLPIYWDELKTTEDTSKFVNLIFQLTSGREKARARADMSFAKTESWKTMIISASNASLLETIGVATPTTTAGIYRIFEYEITGKPGGGGASDAQRILARLDHNYGAVGLEYAKWLGENYEQCDVDMGQVLRDLTTELNATNDERFWITTMGCTLMGARYATELGYLNIDEAELKAFLVDVFHKMRAHRADVHVDMGNQANVVNTLAQYVNAMSANTLITDVMWMSRGRPAPGAVNIIPPAPPQLTTSLYIHIAKSQGVMRVSSTHMSMWLSQRGMPRLPFLRALERELGASKIKAGLGGGTDYAKMQEYLIEIPLSAVSSGIAIP